MTELIDNDELRLPKIGHINYLNCWPITYPLMQLDLPFQLVLGNPQELNKRYARGELKAGAMSSFHFLISGASNDPFILMPDLSISSFGKVGSVLMISKIGFDFTADSIIEVTSQSLTSVNLLKILLLEKIGFLPILKVTNRPDLDKAQAILVIGDEALSFMVQNNWEIYDLGQWWFEKYKLPMVYGVWGYRQSFYQQNRHKVQVISAKFHEALLMGLGRLKAEVIETAVAKTNYSSRKLAQYFYQLLNFNMNQEHHDGLAQFKSLCLKHKLLN